MRWLTVTWPGVGGITRFCPHQHATLHAALMCARYNSERRGKMCSIIEVSDDGLKLIEVVNMNGGFIGR